MTAAEPVREAGRCLLAPATLGGIHALRNALQVLRAYTALLPESGPARDAVRASLSRILEILEVLEVLAGGGAERRPSPEELVQALQLLPELFVYPLRERKIQLDTGGIEPPTQAFCSWDLFFLACMLLEALLETAPRGPEGKLRLDLEEEELRLAWVPLPGSLPFPVVQEEFDPAILEQAKSMGFDFEPTPGRLGFSLRPTPVLVERRAEAFLT